MNTFEDIKIYLPKYLTPASLETLFEGLKQFPDNMDSRMYTDYLNDSDKIYQGDGIKNFDFTNLPQKTFDVGSGMVISNTCDINPENERMFESRMLYCPIINLNKYVELLERNFEKAKIQSHIDALKKQRITSFFFIPKCGELDSDYIALFDRINHCHLDFFQGKEIATIRLFTLSNYGLYLFVVKLSMHLMRINEDLDRDTGL